MSALTRAAQRLILRNVCVFDGVSDCTVDNADVLVEGARILAVSTDPVAGGQSEGTVDIDCGGRFLMPGMTDAHVHLMGNANSVTDFQQEPTGVLYGNTIAEAERMLRRGFTTVRDMGGDTAPVKKLIDDGVFTGPRIFPSQAMISQTAGHADFSRADSTPQRFGGAPSRIEEMHLARVADGVPEILTAVREQLRMGASQIKLALGGGSRPVAFDRPRSLQYRTEEVRAAVQTAADFDTYVAAHVYTPGGIKRAVDAGVRTIEHGHLADESAIEHMGRAQAWLSTQPFAEEDDEFLDPARAAKSAELHQNIDQLYAWSKKHGVRTAWGSDLILEPQSAARQNAMAVRLGDYHTNLEALKILTSGNAEICELAGDRNPYRVGRLGVIGEGAWADMLLVDGDPRDDLTLIADPEVNFSLIVKDGRVVKDSL